jgi:hypothetical protein
VGRRMGSWLIECRETRTDGRVGGWIELVDGLMSKWTTSDQSRRCNFHHDSKKYGEFLKRSYNNENCKVDGRL